MQQVDFEAVHHRNGW